MIISIGMIENEQLMSEVRKENYDVAIAEVFDYAAFYFLELCHISPTRIVPTSTLPIQSAFYEYMDGYLERIKAEGNIPGMLKIES